MRLPLFLLTVLLAQAPSYEEQLRQAQGLLEEGRLLEALEPLRRALRLRPEGAEALWMMGVAHLRLERLEEGLPYVERLLGSAPQRAQVRLLMATYREELGQGEKALEQYQRVLELEPRNPVALYKLGMSFLEREDFLAAEKMFLTIVSEYPRDLRALVPLGTVYARSGRQKEALETLERAVEIDPDSAEAHHALGALYSELGQWAAAERLRQSSPPYEHPFMPDQNDDENIKHS